MFKKLRTKNSYSQQQLADLVNVHQTAVSQWENEKCMPDIDTLKKLARLYKVSIDYLVEFDSGIQYVNDPEVLEYLDDMHKRPEMKMLFKVSKKASKEEIKETVVIVEALRNRRKQEGEDDG